MITHVKVWGYQKKFVSLPHRCRNMETKKIIDKNEALIDALRAACSAYGLSGDSSEYNNCPDSLIQAPQTGHKGDRSLCDLSTVQMFFCIKY